MIEDFREERGESRGKGNGYDFRVGYRIVWIWFTKVLRLFESGDYSVEYFEISFEIGIGGKLRGFYFSGFAVFAKLLLSYDLLTAGNFDTVASGSKILYLPLE